MQDRARPESGVRAGAVEGGGGCPSGLVPGGGGEAGPTGSSEAPGSTPTAGRTLVLGAAILDVPVLRMLTHRPAYRHALPGTDLYPDF